MEMSQQAKDLKSEYMKAYREKHKEQQKEYMEGYRASHRKEMINYNKAYWERKAAKEERKLIMNNPWYLTHKL